VIYNPNVKVTNIQRQVTRKWYNILTTADQQKLVYYLSNGAIFNDVERPLPPVSRSLHSLTLNISEMVRDTDNFNGILKKIYTHPTMTRSVVRSLCVSWASCRSKAFLAFPNSLIPNSRTRHPGLLSLSPPSVVRLERVPGESWECKQAYRVIH